MERWHDGLTVNAYFMGVSFMWNSIHPILLPVMLLSFTESAKNTTYGILTFMGLIIATLVQPLSGALSDQTRHRLGRRRPWIIVGTLLNIGLVFLLISARRFWLLAVAYILLQFTSNLAHGPAQALIPDTIAPDRRGAASGMKNMVDMVGIILAALLASRAMATPAPRPFLAAGLITGTLVVSTAITVFSARERSSGKGRGWARGALRQEIRSLLSIRLRANSDFGLLLLARFFMFLGSFSVQSFGLYYLRDALQLDSPVRMMGNMMIVIGISITLIAYPAGLLSERWGRRTLTVMATLLAMIGTGALLLTQSVTSLLILAGVIGMGMGTFASVNWAWATDLVPPAEAGKYMGLTNLATAGSAAASRLLGPMIDVVNAQIPNGGYTALFVLATLSAATALVVTLRIRETRQSVRVPGLCKVLEQLIGTRPQG
jgi:Na+/melibiose symporter-like transporter